MATSIDKIYEHAMELPNESKAILVERIVEYLGVCCKTTNILLVFMTIICYTSSAYR